MENNITHLPSSEPMGRDLQVYIRYIVLTIIYGHSFLTNGDLIRLAWQWLSGVIKTG